MIGRRPGTDHVNGRLAVGRVEAAAERLAVDGDHLPVGDFVQGRDPTQQTLLELRRLDGGEDRIETIVRRNAGLQIQKPCQPLPLRSAELGNGDEIIGTTDHRADGDDHDIDQRIHHLTTPRIRKFREVVCDPNRLGLRHGIDSWARAIFSTLAAPQQAAKTRLPNHARLPIMAQSPWGLIGAILVGVAGVVATQHLKGLIYSFIGAPVGALVVFLYEVGREMPKSADKACVPPASAGVWDKELDP